MFNLYYLTFLKRDCFSHSLNKRSFPTCFLFTGNETCSGFFKFSFIDLVLHFLIYKTVVLFTEKNFCSVVYFGTKTVNPSSFEQTIKTNVYSYFEKGCRKNCARDNPEG